MQQTQFSESNKHYLPASNIVRNIEFFMNSIKHTEEKRCKLFIVKVGRFQERRSTFGHKTLHIYIYVFYILKVAQYSFKKMENSRLDAYF
jgi:hypothetical protein